MRTIKQISEKSVKKGNISRVNKIITLIETTETGYRKGIGKMQGKYLNSTIIIGVFLLISILFVVWLIPFNLTETMETYLNSLPHPNGGESGLVVGAFTAVFAMPVIQAIVQSAYIPAFLCLLNSAFSLPFSIRNRKSYSTPISVINYGYIVLLSAIIVFSFVKLILFITEIG